MSAVSAQIDLFSLFEAAPQAILAVSSESKIQLVNRRTEVMFGYQREEILGEPLDILLPKSSRAAHVDHLKNYFADPKLRAMGAGRDLVAVRKDGVEFPVEIGLSFVKTPHEVLGLALVSDVTARKRAEEELTRVNRELRRSNAELEQFVWVASHDLQEPLRTIASYLQLLEKRYTGQLDQDARDFIRFAVDGAVRMKGLLQAFLRVAQAGTQATDFKPVPGADLFQSALQNLRGAIADAGAIVTADETLPTIVADAPLIGQVLQNLIGNAIKFHTPGTEPRVHFSAERKGSEWIFSVRDNGIGIDPKHSSRIFDVFERVRNAQEVPGSGVGLSITRKIVERHGGRIWCESEPSKGSTFRFSLPAEPVGNIPTR